MPCGYDFKKMIGAFDAVTKKLKQNKIVLGAHMNFIKQRCLLNLEFEVAGDPPSDVSGWLSIFAKLVTAYYMHLPYTMIGDGSVLLAGLLNELKRKKVLLTIFPENTYLLPNSDQIKILAPRDNFIYLFIDRGSPFRRIYLLKMYDSAAEITIYGDTIKILVVISCFKRS